MGKTYLRSVISEITLSWGVETSLELFAWWILQNFTSPRKLLSIA